MNITTVHGTTNHCIANDLKALLACIGELTQRNIPVLSTQTGGAMPRVMVACCRGTKALYAHYAGHTDTAVRYAATLCGCSVEWEVKA